MTTQATETMQATIEAAAIPQAAMENIALRCREAGLFVIALAADGAVLYHDTAANPFFQRYVLPLLQRRGGKSNTPGATHAVFPYADRRQHGTLVLTCRSADFGLTEDVVCACGQLGIDAAWLAQEASRLPGYRDDELDRQARFVFEMVRDQVRLASLKGELDSLTTQLSNTYEELSLVYQLSGGMRINRSVGDFFKHACLDVMDVVNVRGMGVALNTENATLKGPVLYGSLSLPPDALHQLAGELIRRLGETKAPLLVNHVATDKRFHWLGEHARQLVAVPLLRGEQVLGCIFGLDKLSGEFDTVDSKLLSSIANESAIYLENFMLYDDVRGLMMGLLHSLVSAVDAKDAYTCGHSERVALLSRLLAQEARFGEAYVERVYMAGLLHDVGKIGVPEAVLQKTGKLTPEEFEQIKAHPEMGARILGDIKQLADIIPGVLYHHERYDGKGYPHGLSGESIPLMGRIICLADCFDAMTSSRTYRKALPLEVALTELRRCAGTQFDPELADAFLRIGADSFRELLTDHKRQTKQLEIQQGLRAA